MAHALREPGWYRAALGTLIGAAFGFGLVVILRLVSGLDAFQTEQTGYPQVVVPLITAPFGFLIGFGARWANGCTSGHAIMGLSEGQRASLIATLAFFAGGLLATHVLWPLLLGAA